MVAKTKPKPKAKPKAATRPQMDWEAVERDYRTGRYTTTELASKYGNVVTRQAIGKRAKARGWQKDLSDAVRAATKASLITEAVKARAARAVAEAVAVGFDETTNTVAALGEQNAEVVFGHRKDIRTMADLVDRLRNELLETTTSRVELQALFDLLLKPDLDSIKLAAAQHKLNELMRLHNRIGSVQKLVDSLGKLQVLERKAFDLDDDDKGKGNFESILDKVLE